MSDKFQLKGSICEPDSDIPLNWSDVRSVFGYTTLSEILNLAKDLKIRRK